MIKRVSKRFLSLFMAAVMVLTLVPAIALNAFAYPIPNIGSLDDNNINVSCDTQYIASTECNVNKKTITTSCSAYWFAKKNKYYSNYANLTIKNGKGKAAILSFNYNVVLYNGTIEVDGKAVSLDGSYTYSKELADGESIVIKMENRVNSDKTTIEITDITLVSDERVTTTFEPAVNGSFTVNGKAIDKTYESTQNSVVGYVLKATPDNGYNFIGWYDETNEKYISYESSTTLNPESDSTITAKFVKDDMALFAADSQVFDDLNNATKYALENKISKITLLNDGKLEGNYIIPEGVILLVPFDNDNTLYTDNPDVLTEPIKAPRKAYRTLTLAENATLTVNGGISVGGRYKTAIGNQAGHMTGDYGQIEMKKGSQITVKSGGALYAWGFVTGDGNVTVEDGGTVHEWYQVTDYRGGTASMGVVTQGKEVFPFSQYYVQNVEASLTLNQGAKEIVFTCVTAYNRLWPNPITFIGDDGMFKIVSGSITKKYDGGTDRLNFTINGDMELNSMCLELGGATIKSVIFALPITNNISIDIASGKLTVNQKAALLPGVQVTIGEEAELVVSKYTSAELEEGSTVDRNVRVYIYDADAWNQDYVQGAKFKSVVYAPGKTYNRTDADDLKDVEIDVNGTFTVEGEVYTTAGGAKIYSSKGTGVYVQNAAPGQETVTYQCTQGGKNGTEVFSQEIPITPAKLLNEDDTYTATAEAEAGDTIKYVNGTWTIPCKHKNTEIRDAKYVTETEDGYTGDTYCSDCREKLKNGDDIFHDGWRQIGDNYYYYKDQKPVTDWNRLPYPTDLLPKYAPDAEDARVNVPGKEGNPDNYDYPDRDNALFFFDEDGVFQKDYCGKYTEEDGTIRWVENGMLIWHAGLVKDSNGDYYYFKRSGMVKDVETYVAKTNDWLKPAGYTFDKDGKLMKLEGIKEDINGKLCYFVDYTKNYAGLVEIDGDYYYVNSYREVVRDCTYYVTRNNKLKPAGYYTFDKDGKMIIKNGLVEENGDLYYYVDSAKTAPGLVEENGNYYYIASNMKAVRNAKHYVFADKSNGLKSSGWYWFNEDGTMFLDGIREENGTKYYYKDGLKTYAGLIEIDGSYYYVRSDCSIVCDRSYFVTKTNGLITKSTTCIFDADGKMVMKNGIYREKLDDGKEYLFYYVNNERQMNTGLVKLEDGSYIYVRSGADLAVGSYKVYKTNDLLPQGTYIFGKDGKMIVNP